MISNIDVNLSKFFGNIFLSVVDVLSNLISEEISENLLTSFIISWVVFTSSRLPWGFFPRICEEFERFLLISWHGILWDLYNLKSNKSSKYIELFVRFCFSG